MAANAGGYATNKFFHIICFLILAWIITGVGFLSCEGLMSAISEIHAKGLMTRESIAHYRKVLKDNFIPFMYLKTVIHGENAP